MHLLLRPGVDKLLSRSAVGVSLWLLLVAVFSSVVHRINFNRNRESIYDVVWHSATAHTGWCLPVLSIVFASSISMLMLLVVTAAYQNRLRGISDERSALKKSLAPGPLLNAALASRVGYGALHKAVYITCLLCVVSIWWAPAAPFIEIASVVGSSVIVVAIFIGLLYLCRGCVSFFGPLPYVKPWISFLNPATLVKRTVAALTKHRLGDQFDLLPSHEKEAFCKQAHQAGLDAGDRKIQLAAVQEYNARRQKAQVEAGDLARHTPDVTLSRPKSRL